jgi:predicted nucleotidyltransferase
MNRIVSIVQSLNFPYGKYAVTAGSALELYGIRVSGDIDILVTSDVYAEIQKDNSFWQEIEKHGYLFLIAEKEGVEIEVGAYMHHWEEYQPEAKEICMRAKDIQGVPCVALDDLIAIKKAMGREKDLRDVALIEEYRKKGK